MLGKAEGRRRRGATEDEMVGEHHRLNGHEFEQTPGDSEDREAWWAAVYGVAQSRTRLKRCSSSSIHSVISVSQSCPTLCDAMDCLTPGVPVHRQLPEFTQTHVH